MKLVIHSQTSTVQLLDISSHILLIMWLLIHVVIKGNLYKSNVNFLQGKGPDSSSVM